MSDDELERVDQGEGDQQPQVADTANKAVEGGMAIADMMSALSDDTASVEDRQKKIVEGTQVIGSALAHGVRRKEEKKERERENARNADLERVEDLPSCENCDRTFNRIPSSASTIECADCGATYRVG